MVRYIHLNPLAGQILSTALEALDDYLYCGHSALMGNRPVDWQDSASRLRPGSAAASDKARQELPGISVPRG
ncbi:MAG: hypothetical protein MZV70_08730 [Desulfobacterales bacterium]|nr:hypothetical protein [Desulfobacterales bacterium]